QRLVLNKRLAIESKTGSEVVIFNFDTNARFKLTTAVYQLICEFGAPVYVDDVVSKHSAKGHLVKVISELIEKEILVQENEVRQPKEIKLTVSSQTMFNSPRRLEADCPQISLVGVPFDLGNMVAAGTRQGPHGIRTCSLQHDYHVELLSGRP